MAAGCVPDGWRSLLGASRRDLDEAGVRSAMLANPSLADNSYTSTMNRVGHWRATLRNCAGDEAEVFDARGLLEKARCAVCLV
jgi:hypothetical protein